MNDKYPHVGFRLNHQLKERLRKEASESGMSLSQYVLYLVKKALGEQ